MDGLRPEVDELDRFKNRAAGSVKESPKKTKAKPVQEKRSHQGSGSGFSVFLMLLMIAGFSALGWYSWQQQQEINGLNARLGDASGFMDQSKLLIARLEGKLSETGEVLAETGTSAEKKLAFLDSEMRKLWGVSNDKNKKAIEENQAALASLEGQIDKLQKAQSAETRALKQDLLALSSDFKEVLKLAKGFESRVNTVANEVSLLRTEQEATNTNVKNQLAQQKQLVESFKGDTKSYLERLAKMDLSLESINASRRQLNERVVDLDKKVNDLLLKLTP